MSPGAAQVWYGRRMPRLARHALVALLTGGSFALLAGDAGAAGPAASAKKRCISSAETGQTLRAEGKLLDARASFAQCTAAECPAPVRKDCGHWVEELDAASPSFSIRLEDPAGREVEAGQITVDGTPRAPSDRGRATTIDPGTHVFEWVRPEGNVRADVVLHEGEQNKIVLLKAPPVPGQGDGGDGEVATGDGTGSATGTSGAGGASHRRASNLPWLVSGGVALASAGVGFVLWGVGSHEHSTLQDGCATTHSCSSSDVSSSRDKLIVGDVLVGVGIVAAASAVYFFVKSRSDHGGATMTASLPLVTPGGVGFQF
jgi:hypothetical protein